MNMTNLDKNIAYSNCNLSEIELNHYTSLDKAKSIFNNGKILLYFREYEKTVDKAEMLHINRMFFLACEHLLRTGQITQSFYDIINKITISTNLTNCYYNDNNKQSYRAFVKSFSRVRKNQLWDEYAQKNGTPGCCISLVASAFDSNENAQTDNNKPTGVSQSPDMFYEVCDVIYNDDEKQKIIEDHIIETRDIYNKNKNREECISDIQHMLAKYQLIMKSEEHKKEHETRVIAYVIMESNNINTIDCNLDNNGKTTEEVLSVFVNIASCRKILVEDGYEDIMRNHLCNNNLTSLEMLVEKYNLKKIKNKKLQIEIHLAKYNALMEDRISQNEMFWATVPAEFTAQAFLYMIILDGGNNFNLWSKAIASFLSALIGALTVQLFERHRVYEMADALQLEEMEKYLNRLCKKDMIAHVSLNKKTFINKKHKPNIDQAISPEKKGVFGGIESSSCWKCVLWTLTIIPLLSCINSCALLIIQHWKRSEYEAVFVAIQLSLAIIFGIGIAAYNLIMKDSKETKPLLKVFKMPFFIKPRNSIILTGVLCLIEIILLSVWLIICRRWPWLPPTL